MQATGLMDYSLLLGIEKVVPDYLKQDYTPIEEEDNSHKKKKMSLTSEFDAKSTVTGK